MAEQVSDARDLGALETKIQEIIKRVTFSDVNKDQPLISTNILDSIGVVDFIVELEKLLNVSIDLQQVNAREFDTVEQMARKLSVLMHA